MMRPQSQAIAVQRRRAVANDELAYVTELLLLCFALLTCAVFPDHLSVINRIILAMKITEFLS
jgi:hypothetical protein